MRLDKHPSRLMLDDFEHGDLTKYETNHHFVGSYALSITEERAKTGHNSLKLSYHFGQWTTGNGAMYIQFKESLQTKTMPEKLAVWVYGDGQSPWLRATLLDGEGSRKTLNLTEENIDWVGWKYIDVDIDHKWKLPLRLEKIYAVETDKSRQGNPKIQGDIYFDLIQFVYKDDVDLKGPEFTNVFPKVSVIYNDSFTFSAKVFDEMSGVDDESIRVKVNGQIVEHSYSSGTGLIQYQLNDLREGEVEIEVTAYDQAGNVSQPSINKIYSIDLSPDLEKPVLSNLTPSHRVVIHTDTPRITFKVMDEKSGIDVKDIKLRLDGKILDVTYDEETGWCYGYPKAPIPAGEHRVDIIVTDRAGNQLGPVEECFFTKDSREPSVDQSTIIPVIPDTHSPDYLNLLLKNVAKEPADFVIHMGDLVDEATQAEFQEIKDVLADQTDQTNQALLTVAGNHESFQGNLALYQAQFGVPTYHLEYGDSLIVVLNSAFEQSISESDSTQFHYLQQLLRENKQKNIIIATHVPVQDAFGTSHQMVEDDSQKLEELLSDYKRNNQDVSITVLFGHLHVLQSWKKGGVTYIINGNGAGKGYVSHEKGNILGYGILEIGRAGVKYNFKPIVEKLFIQPENSGYVTGTDDWPDRVWEMPRGSTQQFRVFGRVNVLKSNYTVDFTPHDLINIKWQTSDDSILSISPSGLASAKKVGTATITVALVDVQPSKTAKITIGVT